jgi:hypothetical protein
MDIGKTLEEALDEVTGFAREKLLELKSEGIALVQEIVPVVKDALLAFLKAMGQKLVEIVLSLMQKEWDHLKGIEKHNLAVTMATDYAQQNNIPVNDNDTGPAVKLTYVQVMGAREQMAA